MDHQWPLALLSLGGLGILLLVSLGQRILTLWEKLRCNGEPYWDYAGGYWVDPKAHK